MRNDRGVLVPDRRRMLMVELRRRGSAHVEQLSDLLGVSPSTVRRDLALLEAAGELVRAHGGAVLDRRGVRSSAPESSDVEVKHKIGRAAAELIEDGMTVMILSGSTTATMLPYVGLRSVTVVTNGLDIGHTLAGYPDVTVVMIGGVLHRDQMTFVGPMTEQNMADLHVDVLFAGAYGISPEAGVTGAKVIQAGYHHSMLRHTDSLVVLADASKFGRSGPTVLAEIEQVDTFVTDAAAPPEVVTALRERGAAITLT